MLRTASSLPPEGLLTLGSDPARFQTEPPACYRASWQLPGPDSHRQATTSFRPRQDRWTITSQSLDAPAGVAVRLRLGPPSDVADLVCCFRPEDPRSRSHGLRRRWS